MFRRRKSKKKLLRRLFSLHNIIIVCAIGLLSVGAFVLWAATLRIPSLDNFQERIVEQSTKIYDRTGEVLLFDVHEDVQRTVVSFDNISVHIKNATVAIEDAEFYEHKGVRPLATLRALFLQPLRGKGIQGGSTITQQVLKNAVLTAERKVSRKLKEWILAIRLEQQMTKEEILGLYLNETPYGGNVYGVEEASRTFFGVSATDVSLAEAAYLAALPQAPTFYSPYGNNTDRLEERKNLVLAQMLANDFIDQETHDVARAEEVVFEERPDIRIKAPHFVFHVIDQLVALYGEQVLEEQGLRVITSLDFELQQQAEEILKRTALENEEKFNAENAALVAVDPRSGDILTMVGSRDYFDETIDGKFNVALSHRQPGSSFKPFVYASAFKKGYSPDTVVFDLPTEFSSVCSANGTPDFAGATCYSPSNYDFSFKGPISLRNALAQSLNIPAVKTLYLAGLDASLQTARDLGISSLGDVGQYGLTLVLGGGEVSPLEMAGAYGVLANAGVRNDTRPILRVEDSTGNLIQDFTTNPRRVIDENITRQISDILSDNVARTPAFGADSFLHFANQDVAVKTGTTNDFRDAWIVGYTPNIAVATWAGNNDNSSMEKKVAGFIVAPMWREFMNVALAERAVESFAAPRFDPRLSEAPPIIRGQWKGGESFVIDTVTGLRATELTPIETQQVVTIPDAHSILYWIDKDNPLTVRRNNPNDDPQFVNWEAAVRSWALVNGYAQNSAQQLFATNTPTIPEEIDDVHTPENIPDITLLGIEEGETYALDTPLTLSIENESTFPLQKVEYYLNDRFVGNTDPDERFVFYIEDIDVGSEATLRVVGIDEVFNKGEDRVTFIVGEEE